jgi:hypothetical protein
LCTVFDEKGLGLHFGRFFSQTHLVILLRTNGGTSALSMIVRKIPNVLPKFEDMLDQARVFRILVSADKFLRKLTN